MLRYLSPEVLERMAAAAPVSGNRVPTSTPAATRPSQRAQPDQPAPSPSPGPSSPPKQASQPVRQREEPTRQRAPSPPYTSTDDDVLERHVRAMVEKGKLWNSRSVYEELAKKVGALTFHSDIILPSLPGTNSNSTPTTLPPRGRTGSQKDGETRMLI